MSAPVAGSAKVTKEGIVRGLGTQPVPDEVVTADDAKDPAKLAQILGRVLKSVADLRRQWSPRNLDYEDVAAGAGGALVSLQHSLSQRMRWWVTGWKTTATPTTDVGLGSRLLWIQRALWGAVVITGGAANSTVGCRFQAKSPCSVMGARFIWAASTRTVKVTLWRDSDGAILGTGTAATVNPGVYAVTFAAPVTIAGADLNVNLTLGVYDLAGTAYAHTGLDANFASYLPLTLPGLSLVSVKLVSTGDARPTTNSVTELYWVEPILTPSWPALIEDASSTKDRLVLASYVPGTATIRAEEAG